MPYKIGRGLIGAGSDLNMRGSRGGNEYGKDFNVIKKCKCG